MAPAATYSDDYRSGASLEATSDAIDAVNLLRAQTSPPDDNPSPLAEKAARFDANKDKTAFRQYDSACERVKAFYRSQHENQTVAYNLACRSRFHSAARERDEMSVWEAIEKLDTLVDESDPDTELTQVQHLLQTAEAMRRDGRPRWMQVTGLIHDLGKLMYFYGARGQWDVVGDTFPVGCAFDERIIYHETFEGNPDARHPVYGTKFGIYERGCGLDNVMLSWGHDEYLYHVVKDQSVLPPEALAMIRYHSFYPWHREGAYRELMTEKDYAMLEAVRTFNPYDLYSKSDDAPSVEELKVCFSVKMAIWSQ